MTQNVQECYFNPFFIFLNKTTLNLSLVNVMCLLGKKLPDSNLSGGIFYHSKQNISERLSLLLPFSLPIYKINIYWFGHLEFKLLNWRQMFFEQGLKGGDWSEILTRLELKTLIISASLICHQSLWGENMALDFLKMLQCTAANGLWKTFFLHVLPWN